MRSGGSHFHLNHRRTGYSLIAILMTAASFSSARSLVETSVHANFTVPAADPDCPASETYLADRANAEYETLMANLPSKLTPNVVVGAETPIAKEFQQGVHLYERPTLIRVLEKTFEGVTLAPQAAALSGCTDAICVLKTILGSEEAAKRLIFISLQTGFTVSMNPSHTNQSSSIWNLTELRRFSNTAKIIPQMGMKTSSPVTLYRTGYASRAAAEASSESWIQFFKGAFDNDETPWDGSENGILTDKTFIHEYCHLIDYEGRNEAPVGNVIQMYRSKIAKYQPRGLGWGKRGIGEEFVTEYAKTSHAEDFAESCAYFVIAPRTLESRAPTKYAAMRDLVFGGRDFKNAFWNRPLFPEVSELFSSAASENRCESAVLDQIENIRLLGDGVGHEIVERTSTRITTMRHSHWWITSDILKNARTEILDEAIKMLEASPTYCARGGENALRLRAVSICSETQKKLQKIAKRENAADELKTAALECVREAKNLDSACVDAKIVAKIQSETQDPLMLALSKRYQTAPLPISIQSEAMKSVSILDWLGACLSPIGSVGLDVTGKTSYELKGPTALAGGSLILPINSDVQSLGSVQNACLSEIRNGLRNLGYTVPTWTTQESVDFYKALPDFEKYVSGIENVIFNAAIRKTCGVNGQSACTDEDVMKRYKGWETVYRPAVDAPARTKGLAPELVRIVKNTK